MIVLENISKVFHAGKVNEVQALKHVNLRIGAGEFVVMVGANGSGKTTLLNLVAGSIRPSSGKVWIDGREVTGMQDYDRSRWVARVFQNPLTGTAPDLSILDNFRLAALRTSSKKLKIGVNRSFKQHVQERIAMLGMGLENKILQPMGTLSGGQRQALTLLMSVMDEVKVLLLDEPAAALDPRSAGVVMKTADQLISTYRLTALLITHNLKDAFQYGNRIIHIREGAIQQDLSGSQRQELKQQDLYGWFG